MENSLNEILYCVDQIAQKSHGSKLTSQFFKTTSKQSKEVSKYLGTENDRLSVYWSIFFGLSIQNTNVDFDDFARYVNISIVKAMSFASDFDELVKMKVLRHDKSSDGNRRRRKVSDRLNCIKYFVPAPIILSLTKGQTTLPKQTKENLSEYEILDVISKMISDDFHNEVITYLDLIEEIQTIFDENPGNKFIKKLSSFELPVDELVILLIVCSEFTDNEESLDLVRILKILFPDTHTQLQYRKAFMAGKTKVQELDLLTFKTGEFVSDREICLTEHGSSTLFEEDAKFFVKQEKPIQKDIILSTSIIEKQLFFNEKERKNLEFLTDLLQPDNYKSVMQRMMDIGLKPQILALIHGLPGVGKTEFVYQVARSTGRNIKRIELSATKNHFFGDSERLTYKVFKDFEALRTSSGDEPEPIFFVNEIDGWLGQRTIGGNSSIDQTQNAIQSIILQQLEEFQGILFGSCNSVKRFDSSYLRRFGFKVEVTPPDQMSRYNLLRYKLAALSDEQILYLSENYELTGGMIDNIYRKLTMSEILSGKKVDIEQIEIYCQEEFLENSSEKRRIGYCL